MKLLLIFLLVHSTVELQIQIKLNQLPKITTTFLPVANTYTQYLSNNNSTVSVSEPSMANFSVFQNESLIILNRNYNESIYLHCSAFYPVTWTMDSIENQWVQNVIAERQVKNISDPNTYIYSIILKLERYSYQDNVEKFICHGIENKSYNLKSEILIVYEMLLPPFWNIIIPNIKSSYQNQTFYPTTHPVERFDTIYWKSTNNNNNNNNILLPCYSLNINESYVQLYRKINNVIELLIENEMIQYEEFIGFHISPSLILTNVTTNEFICVLKKYNDSKQISKDINLTTLSFEVENLEISYADREQHTSNSNKASSRHKITTQDFIAIFIIKINTVVDPTNLVGKTALQFSKKISKGGYVCCVLNKSGHSGNLGFTQGRCVEPLICQTKKHIFSLGSVTVKSTNRTCIEAYDSYSSSWQTGSFIPISLNCVDKLDKVIHEGEIIGNIMNSLTVQRERPYSKSNPFIGETLKLICSANSFYFARGLFWKIHWANKTVQMILGNQFNNMDIFYENRIRLSITLNNNEIKIISCLAPIWNSSDWITKDFVVNTQVSKRPTTSLGEVSVVVQNISFYTGETINLDCEFDGIPKPIYEWIKASNEFSSKQLKDPEPAPSIFRRRMGGFNSLKDKNVRNISVTTNHSNVVGVYKCTAINLGGNATKIFNIHAIAPIAPKFDNENKEIVLFYNNEKNQRINCSILQSHPTPIFTWTKYGQNLTGNTDIEIITSNQESYIIFKQIKPEHEGVYICYVANLKGSASKEYTLNVIDHTRPQLIHEIIIVVLLVILTFVFVGWIWIYKIKSVEISNLKQVVEFHRTMGTADSLATITSFVND